MIVAFARPFAAFALLVTISAPAHAYLDPATGSIIVQSVIAVAASWVAYSKLFASRTREFLGRFGWRRNKSDAE